MITEAIMPKISIITATLNSAATINETLESIRGQDYPDIEHIIVDGESTDATLGIVREYSHVCKCISEPDKGIYYAMNKGIQLATGEVVGILNSGDVYQDDAVLSRVAERFQREGCEAVYGDLVYVDARDARKVVRYWRAGVYRADAFMWGWMPPHPTFFVRRSLYKKYGGFSLQFKTAADYELLLRFIHKYRISTGYIPEILVRMRNGGASNHSWIHRLQANQDDRRSWTVNGLEPYWFTRYLKPLRKLHQFIWK
jgi:glycosyltransferase involved in cell wall biosynthesis